MPSVASCRQSLPMPPSLRPLCCLLFQKNFLGEAGCRFLFRDPQGPTKQPGSWVCKGLTLYYARFTNWIGMACPATAGWQVCMTLAMCSAVEVRTLFVGADEVCGEFMRYCYCHSVDVPVGYPKGKVNPTCE